MKQLQLQLEETQLSRTQHNTSAQQSESAGQETMETVTPLTETAQVEASSVLTTLLRQEARSRRREKGEFLVLLGMFFAAMVWIINRLASEPASYLFNLLFAFSLFASFALGIFLHLARRSYRRKRSLTQALAKSRDISQIGPLVQTLRVENTPVRNLVKLILIEQLPDMQASDSEQLGDAERDILLRQLSISPTDLGYRDLTELFSRSAVRREIDLRLSILKALEQVGSAKELPVVERLSRGNLTLNSSTRIPIEVREAAQQCLPFLRSRATEQLAGRQLLRASSADATTGEALLRPAIATIEDASDELVRAADRPR